MTTRRGFLKLAAATAGAIGLTKYAEPWLQLPETHEWVEDRGDFYVVRVPQSQRFANERLDKPTIFLLGAYSMLEGVQVDGFTNISAMGGAAIQQCHFNASRMEVSRNRSVVEMKAFGATMRDCLFVGNGASVAGLHILPGSDSTTVYQSLHQARRV